MTDKATPAGPARVSIITPDGKFDTIGAEYAEEVVRAGGRVLTRQEVAQRAVDERYQKLPLAQKALGVASLVSPLAAPFAKDAPPALETYRTGVSQAFTGGLREVATKKAIGAISGEDAARDYVQQLDDQRTAAPQVYTAGELAGYGGAALAGRGGGFGGAVAELGGVAEQGAAGVARALAGEAPGLAGRAATTALKLGMRGAAEGVAIKTAEVASDAALHDHDLASDKLFSAIGTGGLYGGATGAVLGAGGSLLASGLGAGRRAIGNAIARSGEEAATAAAGAERAIIDGAADAEQAAQGAAASWLKDLGSEAGTKNRALDRIWGAIGKGFGLQSTEFSERAARYLPNGTRDVAEVLVRKGIFNPRANPIEAAKALTPSKIAPAIDAAIEATGKRIGDLTDASGGRVDGHEIMAAVESIAKRYDRAATKPIAKSLRAFGRDLDESLRLGDFGTKDGVPIRPVNPFGQRVYNSASVQDLLRERKALDLMVFENASLNPSIQVEVKRELRGKLEDLAVDALDKSSGRLSGELATEYKALKKDYLALNIASDVAHDSAARADKAAFLGLGALTAGGGNPIKAIAYKVAKEKGDAFAAAMLWQEAERGNLARWVGKQDNLINRASKGLLVSPTKEAAKASEAMPPPRGLATKALARVAAFTADPESFLDHATRETEAIEAHSPELATGIVTRQVRAMTFLASKAPPGSDPDPLDPHPAPKMTPTQEAEFARYAWYCEKPERFFAEVARGKLTPEGAEVAQVLTPRAFAQLQQATAEALATQLARGNRLPFRQRQILGQLLDFAATPEQRPEHRSFLQQNVADVLPSNERIPTAGPSKGPRRMTSQNGSALDRLEGKGPGRR